MKESTLWAHDAPIFQPLAAAWQPADDKAKLLALRSIDASDLGAWLERLRSAGIVINRRNSPDLHAQLTQAVRRPIDSVLCSVLDSDSAACLNNALAARFPLELTAGMVLVRQLVRAKRVTCVTDTRVPATWLSALHRACDAAGIRMEPILNDYPHAEPTLLVWGMTGRRLRPARLPTERGVVVLDAAAAVALGRFVLMNEPMTQVPLAVRDRVRHDVHFVTAPTGILIAELFEKLGLSPGGSVLRSGDLLRDNRIDAQTRLGEGELLIHCTPPPPAVNPTPCTRCGWCVDWCATQVNPAGVLEAAQRDDLELAEKSGLEACIECGVCSYVCPSELPLLEGIRKMQAVSIALSHTHV
jgi:electron transport complex protein RnfC